MLGGADDEEDNCWLTALLIDPGDDGTTATGLSAELLRSGVECRRVWKPMHQQPVFRDHAGTLDGTADDLFARGVTLPSGSAMTDDDMDFIQTRVRAYLQKRT